MQFLHANYGGVKFNLNLLSPPALNLMTTRSQKMYFYFIFISTTSQTVSTDFKVVVKGIKATSRAGVFCHTRIIPSLPKPSLATSKVPSYILYDGPDNRAWDFFRNSARRGRGGRTQSRQYIMGNGDRLDDRGLTERRLSSSISNRFVSAVILTDKQSARNITSTLTECDSASARH